MRVLRRNACLPSLVISAVSEARLQHRRPHLLKGVGILTRPEIYGQTGMELCYGPTPATQAPSHRPIMKGFSSSEEWNSRESITISALPDRKKITSTLSTHSENRTTVEVTIHIPTPP